jgi:glycosyltransferase involved in cell wall biosynthesis
MTEVQPLVTIVIPCFNYAVFLPAAIESALAQTYRPLEVIVVDDGSTDNSAEVATTYPVRLVRQPNQGSSAATNNGVRAGSGDEVVRLDADDVLYPDFVDRTVAALRAHPEAVLAHTASTYFGDRTGKVPFQPFDPEHLTEGSYATCTALVRRSAWEAVGGVDSSMQLCEDWDLWLTFAERDMHGIMVPEVLWGYRQHGASRVRRSMRTLADARREYRLIGHLQDHHPQLFAPRHLLRRLWSIPGRLVGRRMPPAHASRLIAFYAVMLLRVVTRLHQRRPRHAPAAVAVAQ